MNVETSRARATRSFAARSEFHTSSGMSAAVVLLAALGVGGVALRDGCAARAGRRPTWPRALASAGVVASPARRVLSDRSSVSESESESRSRSPTFFATSPTRAETFLKDP